MAKLAKLLAFNPLVIRHSSLALCLLIALAVACSTATTPMKEGGSVYAPDPRALEAFVAVSAGLDSHCALHANGAADCEGAILYDSRNFLPRHQWDQYERGSEPQNARFIDLSVGDFYVCGLLATGKPFCWGDDRYGEAAPPTQETFTAISSGRYHTCALLSDGSPLCWGLRSLLESTSLWDAKFIAISSGQTHTCALRSDGSPVCWGRERYVVDTPMDESFVAISSGGGYTCALRSDGSPVCWGSLDPDIVPPASEKLIAISTGSDKTCALRLDGSPVCWAEPFTSSPYLPGSFAGRGTVSEPSPWAYE